MSTKTLPLIGFLTHRAIRYAPPTQRLVGATGRSAVRRGRSLALVKGQSTSGINNLTWAVLGAVVIMAILYIFGINTYAAKGYEIKALQNQISKFQAESDSLTLKTAELSSMTSIDQAVTIAHLVPVTSEEFLTPQPLTALAGH